MESNMKSDNQLVKERLVNHLKKEVKQIMEEAVTRKYINEDSAKITSMCASVEACLAFGLKRRVLGLFKSASSTAALLQKIAKDCKEAELVQSIQYHFEPIETSSFGSKKGIFDPRRGKPPLKKLPGHVCTHKFLWIRIALTERVLDKIVDYLVVNADKFYAPESLVADPVDGPILASLLVGPCALDFSKMKTPDHLWTDPSADELVLRHRIHGSAVQYHSISNGSSPSPKRFSLKIKRHPSLSTSSCDEPQRGAAKDYVESIHQNHKTSLLYGKNNVLMRRQEVPQPLQGYLSLHQEGDLSLAIKWTPNQLMNTPAEESFEMVAERSQYWDYAICIMVHGIVYLHCHHQADNSGSVVLVGQDGIQYSPLHFPVGGHLLAFVSCLENGLEMTGGKLDPPLRVEPGIGKVFPHHKTSAESQPKNESYDYVFRIICDVPDFSLGKLNLIMHSEQHPLRTQCSSGIQSDQLSSSNSGSTSRANDSPKIFDFENIEIADDSDSRSSMQKACDTMKKQILTRAFFGWVAHCRHLKTVRQHLSGLVSPTTCCADSLVDASSGLTEEIWKSYCVNPSSLTGKELCQLVYFGGVQAAIRKEVWPYLLGHYNWQSSVEEGEALDAVMRVTYEHSVSEWMAIEAIIRQRDRETFAASLAKASGETYGELSLVGKDSTLSNDVFEDEIMSVSSVDTTSEWILSTPSESDRKDSFKSVHSREGSDSMMSPNLVKIERSALTKEASNSPTTTLSANVMVTQPTMDPDCGLEDLEGEKVTNFSFLGNDAKEHDYPSPASSVGGIYAEDLIEEFGLNLHRIDKDVARCDRTYPYFTQAKNLEKLRNIMSTYVWLNLKDGYIQGMCDIAAPLLVIFDDEVMAFSCFSELMKRMSRNFPTSNGMDLNFANMRSLIQVLDPELFDLMHANGDYTHFYFCYRWFLLDFKRELVYDDVFLVWETIWAACHIVSDEFVLFIALAMLECYRDIILDNAMDFTDIIKFFNEMAERHDGRTILRISRDLVKRIQDIINS